MSDKEVEEGIVWAIIGYLGILFLVPLLAKRDNKFAVYHAKQGLVLFLSCIVMVIISFAIGWIPILGGLLSRLITAICLILVLVLFIIGIVNAATGKYKPLPIIGDIAEKWKI